MWIYPFFLIRKQHCAKTNVILLNYFVRIRFVKYPFCFVHIKESFLCMLQHLSLFMDPLERIWRTSQCHVHLHDYEKFRRNITFIYMTMKSFKTVWIYFESKLVKEYEFICLSIWESCGVTKVAQLEWWMDIKTKQHYTHLSWC